MVKYELNFLILVEWGVLLFSKFYSHILNNKLNYCLIIYHKIYNNVFYAL